MFLSSSAPLVQWCPAAAPWLGTQCAPGEQHKDRLCSFLTVIISSTGKLKDLPWSSIFGFLSPLPKVRSSLQNTVTLSWDWWSFTKKPLPSHLQQLKAFLFYIKLLAYCYGFELLADTHVPGLLLFTRRHSLYTSISCRSMSQADFLPFSPEDTLLNIWCYPLQAPSYPLCSASLFFFSPFVYEGKQIAHT